MAKKEDDRLDKIEKKLNDISAKIRRMSENWKHFCAIHVGPASHSDGKLNGFSYVVMFVFLMFICVSSLIYAGTIFSVSNTDNGTARIDSDGAGVATLVADKIQGDELVVSTNNIAVGSFSIINSTQLVFIVSGTTNIVDADITTP